MVQEAPIEVPKPIISPEVKAPSPVKVVERAEQNAGTEEEMVCNEGIKNPDRARGILEILSESLNINTEKGKFIGYKKETGEKNPQAEFRIKNVEVVFNLGNEINGQVNENIQNLIDSQEPPQKALGIDLRLSWLDSNLPKIEKKWQEAIKNNQVSQADFDNLKTRIALETKVLQEQRFNIKNEKGELLPNQVEDLAITLASDSATKNEKEIKANPLKYIEKQLNEASGNKEKTEVLISKVKKLIDGQPPDIQEACHDLPSRLLEILFEKDKVSTEQKKQTIKETGKKTLQIGGSLGALLVLLGWTAMKRQLGEQRQ